MYISVDENNVIVAVSDIAFRQPGQKTVEIDLPRGADPHKLIGTKLKAGRKSVRDLRVAFVCNWGDHCGIATYTGFLHRAMAPKVKEIKIFLGRSPRSRRRTGRTWSGAGSGGRRSGTCSRRLPSTSRTS
jgi:hypothetical protein